jgi:hypothetical protein
MRRNIIFLYDKPTTCTYIGLTKGIFMESDFFLYLDIYVYTYFWPGCTGANPGYSMVNVGRRGRAGKIFVKVF